MEKIWKFLNAPLVVTLAAITAFPILIGLTAGIASEIWLEDVTEAVAEEVVSPFKNMGAEQNKEKLEKLAILKELSVSNVRFAPTTWDEKAKVVGTITNKSDKTLDGFHLTVSLYEGDRLVNVEDEWLAHARPLLPGESNNFGLMIDVEKEAKDTVIEKMTPKVQVARFSIVKPEE